jgi:hypothetical protein
VLARSHYSKDAAGAFDVHGGGPDSSIAVE